MKKITTKIFILLISSFICTAAGYKGTLPNINEQFEYKTHSPKATKGLFNTEKEVKNQNLKKIPRENKAYIDIILKKDKTSPYTNDLNDVILILEKMQKCIKSNGSLQKFNAIASSIIDHADYMNEKYAQSPEKYYISFSKLQNIAVQARNLATLRCESQVYIKYLTYQGDGQVYSKDSINTQIKAFEEELESTIKIMKDSI